MVKVTVKPNKEESITSQMKIEMQKIRDKGYRIVIAGHDWFGYEKTIKLNVNQTKLQF